MKPNKIKIDKIVSNPNNPRVIKDFKFKKLMKSIQDFPEMLKLRPIIVDENFKPIGTVPSSKVLRTSRDSKMISFPFYPPPCEAI